MASDHPSIQGAQDCLRTEDTTLILFARMDSTSAFSSYWRYLMNMMNPDGVMDRVPIAMNADGVLRIVGSRVTVDTLVSAFQDGATAEEIAQQYPSVSLADIYSVIGYYLHQRPEIEAYLARRRREAAQIRQENEARWDPTGIRARLLARRTEKTA